MSWDCLFGSDCVISNGVWNNEGIAYFKLSDELLSLNSMVFEYVKNTFPTVLTIGFFIVVIMLVLSILINLKRMMEDL